METCEIVRAVNYKYFSAFRNVLGKILTLYCICTFCTRANFWNRFVQNLVEFEVLNLQPSSVT